jgi:hypothetical protein
VAQRERNPRFLSLWNPFFPFSAVADYDSVGPAWPRATNSSRLSSRSAARFAVLIDEEGRNARALPISINLRPIFSGLVVFCLQFCSGFDATGGSSLFISCTRMMRPATKSQRHPASAVFRKPFESHRLVEWFAWFPDRNRGCEHAPTELSSTGGGSLDGPPFKSAEECFVNSGQSSTAQHHQEVHTISLMNT